VRSIDPATLAALSEPHVNKTFLVRLEFTGGTLAWHTGYGDIDFDGHTYTAAGHLGSLSPVTESADASPGRITVGVSGIAPAVVAALLSEPALGRPAYVHFAPCAADWQPIGTPILCFKGAMEPPSGVMGAQAAFSVPIVSRLADWARPIVARYNDVDQQARYPGDKGLEFAEQVATSGVVEGDK